ncbi:ABC transporter ATP-binding protein [Paenilisteria rocourtiae]|uniref:ABC-2 type transport system ATP-binding protein n=1 Tax=Listeria rocourtiae TaxID=647910 RepID=A0A4R6ZEY6_9LIST|nr:ABC transporter ATP-binding protein [Listeria rocourtiae]EUJ48930.1 ABC transporter ATP-binding protein [Listeria rocourtiae FSL F6-920]MBC1436191.1 ABC transporter ATP-binding protein [Listeria rocourtiae]MBC1605854.1 ABC transporter ATP-binding protein [Listeria rocourtiae]TDR50688.1 ABC-2 type transport system ATP-binding protein [Listeria rocourtiae]
MLQVENLSITLRERLLEDMNAEFHRGMAYGIVATNGSGKTTLLRILAGLMRTQRGAIYMEESGKRLNLVEIRKKLFYYETSDWLDGHLSALDYLEFVNTSWAGNKADIDEIIEYWGLGQFVKLPIRKYSLGMKQKTLLAMYAASSTDYWLMDEPMNGLDDANQKRFIEFMKGAREQGKCIIFSSHQNDILHEISDKVYYITNKKWIDTAEDVQEESR